MSANNATFEIDVPEGRVAAVCQAALNDLDWRASVEDGSVIGREDPAKLPCHASPASVRLRVGASGEGRPTQIEMRVEVPGFGPISSQHAAERSRVLARAIARQAESSGG